MNAVDATADATARRNGEAAAALVGALVEGGVTHAVVSPGSRNTPLVLACAAHPAVHVWPVLDERVAGFFALGLARATGAPVALACTSGSAGAHYLPAVIEARYSRVPLVVMTANRPPELHRAGAPQTIEQRGLLGVFALDERALPAPDEGTPLSIWRTAGASAVAQATRAPAGPVHLDARFREPLWRPGSTAAPIAPRPGAGRLRAAPRLDQAGVEALADRLGSARRGVFVCGPQSAPTGDARLAPALLDLAERLGWPVLAEAASGVRFGLDSPTLVAGYDAILRGRCAGLTPDCIVRFGQTSTSKPLARWLKRHGEGRMILVDPAGERRDPDHLAELVVEAEAVDLCGALAARLPDRGGEHRWLGRWQAAESASRGALGAACAEGWWEAGVARALFDALPAGAALHAANSMPIRDVDGFLPAGGAHRAVFVSRGANGIDGTLATALGEALGRGSDAGPLALLIGDLATLHDVGGLLFAGQLLGSLPEARRPAMTAVVIDNGGGGIFEWLPISGHPDAFEPLFITPQAVKLAPLCAAAAVRHHAPTDRSTLEAALAESLSRPGLDVIEVRIDRPENLARHRAAWAAAEAAIAEALPVGGPEPGR